MSEEPNISNIQSDNIKSLIYEILGQKVMLDYDLASIYGVKTGSLNQAVKRNTDRFPLDFMFRLTAEEWEKLLNSGMISQTVTSSLSKRKKTSPPFAFTEHEAVQPPAALFCGHRNKDWEVDHVAAWSNDGSTTEGYCQMLCKMYNRAKGNSR